MMDDHVVKQFVDQLQAAMLSGVTTSGVFSQLEMKLDNIGMSLATLANNSAPEKDEDRDKLATEVLRSLAEENVRLVTLLSVREVAMGQLRIDHDRTMSQMRALLQDLSGACIGCKKLSWRPHKADCDWSASAEKLQELFSEPLKVDAGKAAGTDG